MLRLLCLCLALGAAAPSSAQTAPRGFSGLVLVGGGVASNGPAFRLAAGTEHAIARDASLGVVLRVSTSTGAYAPDARPGATAGDTFLEVGPSLRQAWRASERVEVAASAGVAYAMLGSEPGAGAFDLGLDGFGMTVPLEAEVTARIGRLVGVSAAASRSVALAGSRTADPAPVALDQWTATVGLRLGR